MIQNTNLGSVSVEYPILALPAPLSNTTTTILFIFILFLFCVFREAHYIRE